VLRHHLAPEALQSSGEGINESISTPPDRFRDLPTSEGSRRPRRSSAFPILSHAMYRTLPGSARVDDVDEHTPSGARDGMPNRDKQPRESLNDPDEYYDCADPQEAQAEPHQPQHSARGGVEQTKATR
jgi:hypothetical protein